MFPPRLSLPSTKSEHLLSFWTDDWHISHSLELFLYFSAESFYCLYFFVEFPSASNFIHLFGQRSAITGRSPLDPLLQRSQKDYGYT